ncbi:MAG: molybdopterin-dependent oxidoreductase [Planctomycetes bacterium]|nr:molybdopterin-dependent oxidoreductase [Planctomycetota bacterium]
MASCRLCLMEMKLPHPRTRELGWAPKLFPSCQTPIRDGMEVRFDSPPVVGNQKRCMEFFLLNHPLDCPVCDQAGECYLQDYSEKFGSPTSRMVEDKYKNPKKDIGPRTLLYQDRCVMCSRCVRFTSEISGTGELSIVNRGSRIEIDVFPGVPLDNKLQGNVVDLCPVGCLLDKDFLFKQRVWLLKSTDSICPGCSRGCSIEIDQNENRIHRLKPRYNEKVNEWWMCDDGRFGWKYAHRDDRLDRPLMRRGGTLDPMRWEEIPDILRFRFERVAETDDGASAAVVLSPMMSCEEAWLLATFARKAAPAATLVLGHVPIEGEDEKFPKGFTINAEKCPNRRGVQAVIEHFGGPTAGFDEFLTAAGEGKFDLVYLTGGYPQEWITKDHHKALKDVGFLVVHDLWPSSLFECANMVIPGCVWAEREGSFVNCDGITQPFQRALTPLDGVKRDGQLFHELCDGIGLYRATDVRRRMAESIAAIKDVYVPRALPVHAH